MLLACKEYEEYIDKIKTEKWELFDKVMNNEKILQEQKEEWQKLKNSYNKLKGDYDELDSEYQTLLENYILKI